MRHYTNQYFLLANRLRYVRKPPICKSQLSSPFSPSIIILRKLQQPRKERITQRSFQIFKYRTMAPTNPRCIISAPVHAKAIHVTSLAECTRRYRSRSRTKLLTDCLGGLQGEKKTLGAVTQTFILAKYRLGGGVYKDKKIHIRSVLAGKSPEEDTTSTVQDATTVQETPATTTNNSTATATPRSSPSKYSTTTTNSTSTATTTNHSGSSAATTTNHSSTSAATPRSNTGSTSAAIPQETVVHPPPPQEASVDVYGKLWTEDNVLLPMNGRHSNVRWYRRRAPMGEKLHKDSDLLKQKNPLDYFILMFPPEQTRIMISLTNAVLLPKRLK
jgi:hypothetical protein